MHANDTILVLKGVGEKKAALYKKIGLSTLEQLLLHLPRRYMDLRQPVDAATCPLHCPQLVLATVQSKSGEQRIRKGLSIFKVRCEADGMPLTLIFYNAKYRVDALRAEQQYLFYGTLTGNLTSREMMSPQIFEKRQLGSLLPVYSATAGLSSRMIGLDIQQAKKALSPLPEILPSMLLEQNALCGRDEALRLIHAPNSTEDVTRARQRLVFEELLTFSTAMQLLRSRRIRQQAMPFTKTDLDAFWTQLPFSPTNGQRAAVADIVGDVASGRVMNRLIQGDVGSGKTLVSAAAVLLAAQNGLQSAVMAPTELLANQHYQTYTQFLKGFGLGVELLTASQNAKQRREAVARLQSGESQLAVGTHALLTHDVAFARLGLIVTDEQHRFGVAQRTALGEKGEQVHTLVMSATPIPRTLSLILYGDLDVSVIRELPPGRTPVKTFFIDSSKRSRALGFIERHITEGRQAYIVCPLVTNEENTPPELISVEQLYQQLCQDKLAALRPGILHGKMKPREKEAVMTAFSRGEIGLLVASTVVEVGVDVPNATVMLVENAERFGLSQLHQLRGRVGRGAAQSFCILVSDNQSAQTRERLQTLCKTNDGFVVAQQDLKLRGPGDLLGLRQHGEPGLLNADLLEDAQLLEQTQKAAMQLLEQDPALQSPEHKILKDRVQQLLKLVGVTPN